MRWLLVPLALSAASVLSVSAVDAKQDKDTQEKAATFMDWLNRETARRTNAVSLANWRYVTTLSPEALEHKLNVSAEFAAWQKEQWREVVKYPWQEFQDPLLQRQFKYYSSLGSSDALPDKSKEIRAAKLEKLVAEMQRIYSNTKLREWTGHAGREKHAEQEENIQLEPDLVTIFGSETNNTCKLKYYWHGWHQTVGRAVKPLYEEYVNLATEAARLNNAAAKGNKSIENNEYDEEIQKLYQQIQPLYKQLHAYVRRKLSLHYNTAQEQVIDKKGPLPAHLLGNVWAQEWVSIYNITVPYPNKISVDVTSAMEAQNYTALKMFKLSEEFFTSLNLSAMTDTFWKKSILEKPKDQDMVCHAEAWDFSDGEDFRIKMCTRITLEDLKTVHHEMGHIQYFQQYKNQPFIFQRVANSGFHEALGDVIALSVSTAEHLMKIGLLDPDRHVEDRETEINSLYLTALEKVAFLPYGYLLDLWQWEVFRGYVKPTDYNCRFWKLRQDLQGIAPPVERVERDFDAGAKYHVIAVVPYIKYFLSIIIQFQFHKGLCIKAGQYDPKNPAAKPLHQCDIYQSTEAGNALGDMMQMGASAPWQDALEVLTGGREMDARPLLEYFQPLLDWLTEENNRAGEEPGWPNTHTVHFCHDALQPEPTEESTPVDDGCHYIFHHKKIKQQT